MSSALADDGNAATTVVEQQVLKIATVALEDGQVDLFPIEILMAGVVAVVACFQNHVDHLAQGIKQLQEEVEESFAGDRGDQDRHLTLGLCVFEGVDPIALLGEDRSFQSRSNRVGQPEAAVPFNLNMSYQLLCVHDCLLVPRGRQEISLKEMPRGLRCPRHSNYRSQFCSRPTLNDQIRPSGVKARVAGVRRRMVGKSVRGGYDGV